MHGFAAEQSKRDISEVPCKVSLPKEARETSPLVQLGGAVPEESQSFGLLVCSSTDWCYKLAA